MERAWIQRKHELLLRGRIVESFSVGKMVVRAEAVVVGE